MITASRPRALQTSHLSAVATPPRVEVISERLKCFVEGMSGIDQKTPGLTPLLQARLEYSEADSAEAGFPEFVSTVADADFVALPRVWGYYTAPERRAELLEIAAKASRAGKRVLIWHTGDLTPIVPFSNCVVLAYALDRSAKREHWHGAPRFIDDPLASHAGGHLVIREKGNRPTVGFCGYASAAVWKIAYSVLHGVYFRATGLGGRRLFEAPPLLPAAMLRAKVLGALDRSPDVETNFIVRTRYRGGARNAGSTHPTVVEFYDNILNTDYTVCMRGYGNWSIRLYETLACGRIPVFIDTDCRLPFDDTVDWRRYAVWVPVHDVSRTGDYVRDFHRALSNARFRALQRECRELWESRLTLRGFLSHLHEHGPVGSSPH